MLTGSLVEIIRKVVDMKASQMLSALVRLIIPASEKYLTTQDGSSKILILKNVLLADV